MYNSMCLCVKTDNTKNCQKVFSLRLCVHYLYVQCKVITGNNDMISCFNVCVDLINGQFPTHFVDLIVVVVFCFLFLQNYSAVLHY